MIIGIVTSDSLAEEGHRLDAPYHIDRCVNCGAQRGEVNGKLGIPQHDAEGRCFKLVTVRSYTGTSFENSSIGGPVSDAGAVGDARAHVEDDAALVGPSEYADAPTGGSTRT